MGNDQSTLRSNFPKCLISLQLPKRLSWGENVYVCGSIPELGSWNPSQARRMYYRDNIGPDDYWKCVFEVPSGIGSFEYKYIVKRGDEITWEQGSNRSISWQTSPPVVDEVTLLERAPEWWIQLREEFDEAGWRKLERDIVITPRQQSTHSAIVVLGRKLIEPDDGPTHVLLHRVEVAASLYLQTPPSNPCWFIVSGGASHGDECTETEAEVMKRIAIEHGVPEQWIVMENQSRNTIENALFTKEKLLELGIDIWGEHSRVTATRVIVVTSNFHLDRAKRIFDTVIGQPSRLEFWGETSPEMTPEEAWYEGEREAKLIEQLPHYMSFYV